MLQATQRSGGVYVGQTARAGGESRLRRLGDEGSWRGFLSHSERQLCHNSIINHTYTGPHCQHFFSSTWNVGPINLCRLYNCNYEVQLLFWCIPSMSYPAASLSVRLFFSGGADKTKCWLFFLSEKCRVAVKYKTS